tara:strand:+ start:84 stop:254 length:171 start_codon:yes stop_codon:yes gene_type:complete
MHPKFIQPNVNFPMVSQQSKGIDFSNIKKLNIIKEPVHDVGIIHYDLQYPCINTQE